MATAYLSDQQTTLGGTVTSNNRVKPNEIGGRIRVAFFSITLPASGEATGDTIALTTLPIGARLLGGEFCWDTAQGASATMSLGTAASAALYFAAATTNDTALHSFANTVALKYGSELAASTVLLATNGTAAWTASSKLFGHVKYIVD